MDKAAMESSSTSVTGDTGLMVHGINGQMVIPVVALALLIVAFFAKIPGGAKWAWFILLDVVFQVVIAFVAFGAPVVGMLHGLNALLLAWLGWVAARRVHTAEATVTPRDTAMVWHTSPTSPSPRASPCTGTAWTCRTRRTGSRASRRTPCRAAGSPGNQPE